MEQEVIESEMVLPTHLSFKKIQMYEKYPKGQARGRHWKHLKQIIQAENYQNYPADKPNYVNIESPPSMHPRKQICDITGFEYAHRRCVQRWCNEKGDIICEICQQARVYSTSAPPPVFRLGGIPANLRGPWQIARRDVNDDPRIIRVVSSDHNLLDQEYDEYADSTARSILCFRSVAVVFMIVLILRHTLPIFANGGAEYSLSVFLLLLIRTSGIIVPIYLILRAMTALVHRRRHLVFNGSASSFSSSDEEAGPTLVPGGGVA